MDGPVACPKFGPPNVPWAVFPLPLLSSPSPPPSPARTGPSYTTSVCPKFTQLGEFRNNTAHSNMFYGLRIYPEYFPRNVSTNVSCMFTLFR